MLICLILCAKFLSYSRGCSGSSETTIPQEENGNGNSGRNLIIGRGVDDQFNQWGNDLGLTLIMLKSGNFSILQKNAAATQYNCKKPGLSPLYWSKLGPIGDGAFFEGKIVMCGISIDQTRSADDIGCAVLKPNNKWEPLQAKLPDVMRKSNVRLSFITTPQGLWGMINGGNTMNYTYRLPSTDSRMFEFGPARPEILSDFCIITMGSPIFSSLLGGKRTNGKATNSFFVFDWDLNKWTAMKPSMPDERSHLTCGLRRVENYAHIMVVGGLNSKSKPMIETWSFNTPERKWNSMIKFDNGGNIPHGLIGSALTMYFMEPLVFGGRLKAGENGELMNNSDWFHLREGDDNAKSFWTKLDREAFPTLFNIDPANPISFSVNPDIVPSCHRNKMKHIRRSLPAAVPLPTCNIYCGSCCRADNCRPCNDIMSDQNPPCRVTGGKPEHVQFGYRMARENNCNFARFKCNTSFSPPYYGPCSPIRAIPPPSGPPPPYPQHVLSKVYVIINVWDVNGGEGVPGATVHMLELDETFITDGNGTVKFSVKRLSYVNLKVTCDGYNAMYNRFQVEMWRNKQYFNVHLSKMVDLVSSNISVSAKRKAAPNTQFVSSIVLTWHHMPQDLDLHLIEYSDKGFTKQTCAVSSKLVGKTVEETCKQSKVVAITAANATFGWEPEKIGFIGRAPFYYAIEVYDHSPMLRLNDKNPRAPGNFSIRISKAQVTLYDVKHKPKGEPVKTIRDNAMENFYDSEEYSHWFVGCFFGNKHLSSKNFIPVNQGFTYGASKDDPTEFLLQTTHKKYCGGKL